MCRQRDGPEKGILEGVRMTHLAQHLVDQGEQVVLPHVIAERIVYGMEDADWLAQPNRPCLVVLPLLPAQTASSPRAHRSSIDGRMMLAQGGSAPRRRSTLNLALQEAAQAQESPSLLRVLP
jgi:hypothetical protein